MFPNLGQTMGASRIGLPTNTLSPRVKLPKVHLGPPMPKPGVQAMPGAVGVKPAMPTMSRMALLHGLR